MQKDLEQHFERHEAGLRASEAAHGPDSLDVAERLEAYATALKDSKTRLLDAVNMHARAQVIRGRLANRTNLDHSLVAPATHAPTGDPLRKCPFCAEAIKADAIRCRFCSSRLVAKQMQLWTGFIQGLKASKKLSTAIAIVSIAAIVSLVAVQAWLNISFSLHYPVGSVWYFKADDQHPILLYRDPLAISELAKGRSAVNRHESHDLSASRRLTYLTYEGEACVLDDVNRFKVDGKLVKVRLDRTGSWDGQEGWLPVDKLERQIQK